MDFPCYKLPFEIRPLRPCEISTGYCDDFRWQWSDIAGPFRETRRTILATTEPGPFVDWLAELFWTAYWNMWPHECGAGAVCGLTHVGINPVAGDGSAALLHIVTCVLATGARRMPPESGEAVLQLADAQRRIFDARGYLLSQDQEVQIYEERTMFAHHLYDRGEAMATTRLRSARDRAVRKRAVAVTKETLW